MFVCGRRLNAQGCELPRRRRRRRRHRRRWCAKRTRQCELKPRVVARVSLRVGRADTITLIEMHKHYKQCALRIAACKLFAKCDRNCIFVCTLQNNVQIAVHWFFRSRCRCRVPRVHTFIYGRSVAVGDVLFCQRQRRRRCRKQSRRFVASS